MRKLKFRCFDIEKKIMVEDCSHIQRDGLEVTQFTGLLDKRGKEIYEGDIIKDSASNNYEVKWSHPASFVFKSIPDGHEFYIDRGLLRTSEVIGNIYENGYLIK